MRGIRKILISWATRGYRTLIDEIKALSHYCRAKAVSDIRLTSLQAPRRWLGEVLGLPLAPRGPGERVRFSQVARFARSLPEAPEDWHPGELENFETTVCPIEEPVTDPKVLEELRLYAKSSLPDSKLGPRLRRPTFLAELNFTSAARKVGLHRRGPSTLNAGRT